MNLLDLGIRVLAILGLGMAPVVDQALSMPGRGELAQGTGTAAREFTLVSALYADGPGPRHLQALRSGLIDAFKPDLVTTEQPLILRYQACDDEGDPLGDSLDIVCKYRSGLEGNWDNHQQERLALNFKMYFPMIKSTFDSGIALGYQTTVADADYILKRGADGIWAALASGNTGTTLAFAQGPDGLIYIGGSFLNVGDANGDYITSWNGTAFGSLGTGMNGVVNALAIGPDGTLYAGGAFTLAGGVADTVYIAKWNGTVWAPLSTGMSGGVNALAVDPTSGYLYVGGLFANQGDANGDNIVMWDGSNWSSLGTGVNGEVDALAVGPDGMLYAGGVFTLAGGVAGTVHIAKWDGFVWTPLSGGTNGDVLAIAIGNNGIVYVGGSFTNLGDDQGDFISSWNGVKWTSLSVGMGSSVYWLFMDKKSDLLYATGTFLTAGGLSLPDRMAVWNGSIWLPMDVDLPGSPTIQAIFVDKAGVVYVGFTTFGNALSATVTTTNPGSTIAYPKIILFGPGKIVQIKNYTTGKSIFFDLTLLVTEIAVLNLDPQNFSFISNWRGSLLNTILPGSNTNFPLLPGPNNISAYYVSGTTGTSAIDMTWQSLYWSPDGAAWK